MDFDYDNIKKLEKKTIDFEKKEVEGFVSQQIQRLNDTRDVEMDFSNLFFNKSNVEEYFNNEGLGYNSDHISSFNRSGNRDSVVLSDGSTYIFSDGKLSEYSNGNCNISFNNSEKINDLKELVSFDDNSYFDYSASIKINNVEVASFYSLGNENINTKQMALNFGNEYQKYSTNVLEKLSSNNFGGIVCSSLNLNTASNLRDTAGSFVGTSENGKKFIFVPAGEKFDYNSEYYKKNNVHHETAHVLENVMGKLDSSKIQELYNKYKNILPSLQASCYGVASHTSYNETPNSHEFFADSVTNYYLNKDELKRYMVDMYNYLDEVLA